MAETYSLSVTGQRADQQFAAASLSVGDSAGPDGMHGYVMRLNTPILCKNPDGSKSWYTIDAERSRPGATLVMTPL